LEDNTDQVESETEMWKIRSIAPWEPVQELANRILSLFFCIEAPAQSLTGLE
jgi:hypothetical protein